jgi:hypothetical protein
MYLLEGLENCEFPIVSHGKAVGFETTPKRHLIYFKDASVILEHKYKCKCISRGLLCNIVHQNLLIFEQILHFETPPKI